MTITIDSAEKTYQLRRCADKIRRLSYPNLANPEAPYSYDILVETNGGQKLRGEHKQAPDLVASFLSEGNKLDRQSSYVDFLIVEWNDLDILAGRPNDEDKAAAYDSKYKNAKKHLARLSLAMPVIQTHSLEETVMILKYLEARTTDVGLFENKVNVKGQTMLEKIARCVVPSLSVENYEKYVRDAVDRDLLFAALNIEAWPVLPRTKTRVESTLTGDKEVEE